MPHPIPSLTLNTTPASQQVASTDDVLYAWAITLPDGQTPSSAAVTVYDHIAGTDASDDVKDGTASVSGVDGESCTVTQRLSGWTNGRLYRCVLVVSSASGLDFSFISWFDCVS